MCVGGGGGDEAMQSAIVLTCGGLGGLLFEDGPVFKVCNRRNLTINPYSARMSPENTHKLMGFYMKVIILGVNTMYMLFCLFKLFLIGCIGLMS